MIERIRKIAAAVALVLLSIFLVEAIYTVHIVRPKVYEAVSNLNDTSSDIKEYVAYQIEIVRSPAYQKNFEHASELGDIAAKTVAQIARQTIPRLNRNLDDLSDTQGELKRGAVNLADFIKATNFSINERLLPEVTAVAHKLGVSVDDVDRVVQAGLVSVETLNKVLADPSIPRIFEHVEASTLELDKTMEHLDAVMLNVEEASKRFPELFDLWNKYSRTANRFHKWVLLAQILNLLGGIPRP